MSAIRTSSSCTFCRSFENMAGGTTFRTVSNVKLLLQFPEIQDKVYFASPKNSKICRTDKKHHGKRYKHPSFLNSPICEMTYRLMQSLQKEWPTGQASISSGSVSSSKQHGHSIRPPTFLRDCTRNFLCCAFSLIKSKKKNGMTTGIVS